MTRCASSSVAPNVAWFRNWNASAFAIGGGGGGGGGCPPPPPDPLLQPATPSNNEATNEISFVFITLIPTRSGKGPCLPAQGLEMLDLLVREQVLELDQHCNLEFFDFIFSTKCNSNVFQYLLFIDR